MIRAIVHFDEGILDDIQAKALFDFEVALRKATGLDVRVFKQRLGDDSKLRILMDARRSKK